MKFAKKAAKALIAAVGAGGSAALVVAESGSQGDTKAWLYAVAWAFATGVVAYWVPNRA